MILQFFVWKKERDSGATYCHPLETYCEECDKWHTWMCYHYKVNCPNCGRHYDDIRRNTKLKIWSTFPEKEIVREFQGVQQLSSCSTDIY